MQTEITELLGIKYPIFQGGMAQISKAPLVAAVGDAGGIGFIASAGMTSDELREEIRQTRELTDKPFGVNILLFDANVQEMIDVVCEEGVKVITTGAGTPKHYMSQLKAHDVKVFPVIPSVKLAQKMEEIEVDGVIAEGAEAGGHIGTTSTMTLIPQVVDAVDIPVIAAGGIADHRGVAAAMALGAVGIQAGTVFLATEECSVADAYKQQILTADDTGTVVTGMSLRMPVRNLQNELTTTYLEKERKQVTREELEKLTNDSLEKAVKGNIAEGSMMAGQISGLITEIKTCAEVIQNMVHSFEK